MSSTAEPSPLDHAIWSALNSRQKHLAEAFGSARRFLPEVSVLSAIARPEARAYADLAEMCQPGDRATLFDALPYQPQPGWELVVGAPMLQMVRDPGSLSPGPAPAIVQNLGVADVPAMLELTRLTKPGPFSLRTHELGEYVGIRVDGQLAAMCGERLRVPGMSEMSAICTHPDHTRKGYAKLLMNEVARRMLERGDTPFLHVREDNKRAIAVYEAMGFRARRLSNFLVLNRV